MMMKKSQKMKTNLFQMSHQKNPRILRNHLKVKTLLLLLKMRQSWKKQMHPRMMMAN